MAAVTMTEVNSGFEEGLKGRAFKEYFIDLSDNATAFSLDGVTTAVTPANSYVDAGWALVTRISVVPLAQPGTLKAYFDGTTVKVEGLATNGNCYLYVAGDRG